LKRIAIARVLHFAHYTWLHFSHIALTLSSLAKFCYLATREKEAMTCTKNFCEKWPKNPDILRGKKVEIVIVRPGFCMWLIYNWVSEVFYFSLLPVAKFG
jgi:hypothetical protein